MEKKIYKGPSPTCHHFNTFTATSNRLLLLIGFTHGQIQLIDVVAKEYSKLFNEERNVDNSKVTNIRWVPNSANQFLASHASGSMYVYDETVQCDANAPTYQVFLKGSGFTVHTCSARTTRNPLFRWTFETGGAIHDFAFSPCSKYLAISFANGLMRIYNFDKMEPLGTMCSYFGGIRCLSWSHDGQFVATGGEDDHVAVWSFADQRVVCRGKGHQSWATAVAFDPWTSTTRTADCAGDCDTGFNSSTTSSISPEKSLLRLASSEPATSYRFASVGDDARICLWELTDDVLTQHSVQSRLSTASLTAASLSSTANGSAVVDTSANKSTNSDVSDGVVPKFASLSIAEQHRKKVPVFGGKRNQYYTLGGGAKVQDEKLRLKANGYATNVPTEAKIPLGSPACPRLDQVPLLEPLVCKKICHERLTALVFREEGLVVGGQDGIVSTWARPGQLYSTGYL